MPTTISLAPTCSLARSLRCRVLQCVAVCCSRWGARTMRALSLARSTAPSAHKRNIHTQKRPIDAPKRYIQTQKRPKCPYNTCSVAHSLKPHTLQHTATHSNTLQHTATHCNTLQHTATHCNTRYLHTAERLRGSLARPNHQHTKETMTHKRD